MHFIRLIACLLSCPSCLPVGPPHCLVLIKGEPHKYAAAARKRLPRYIKVTQVALVTTTSTFLAAPHATDPKLGLRENRRGLIEFGKLESWSILSLMRREEHNAEGLKQKEISKFPLNNIS